MRKKLLPNVFMWLFLGLLVTFVFGFYISTKENVETVLNAFIIKGTKKDLIPVRTEAYLDGFFSICIDHISSPLWHEIH